MWRLQRARPWSRWTLVVKMSEDEVEVIGGSVLSSCSKETKCLPFGQRTQITLICMLLSYPSNMMRSKTPWEDCPGRSVQCKQNMVSNMRLETQRAGRRGLPWTLRAHVPILIPFRTDESREEAVTSVKDGTKKKVFLTAPNIILLL